MADRPGVLFRFELLDALEQLDPADAGQLFLCAMRYGKDGTPPAFQNPLLSVVWPFIKTAVDHDAEAYDGKILQKRYAVYVRETRKTGAEPVSFDEWRTSPDITRYQPLSGDIHNQEHIQYHTHSHNQEQAQDHTQSDSAVEAPRAFDRFWEAYPKKKNKIDAQKAFKKVKVPLQTLLDAIERQKQSPQWKKDSGQFVPYPAAWLNRGAWEDETEAENNDQHSGDPGAGSGRWNVKPDVC